MFDKLKGVVKGVQDAQIGEAGSEPCTLDRFAQIDAAQSSWVDQGHDVDAMREQEFGLTALDWSNVTQYWSMRIAGDYTIGLQYNELQQKYAEQYKVPAPDGRVS